MVGDAGEEERSQRLKDDVDGDREVYCLGTGAKMSNQ